MISEPVILAMPHRGAPLNGAARAFYALPTAGRFSAHAITDSHSILIHNFNTLWAGARNLRKETGAKYFAMLHDDVVPSPGWLDILVDELELYDADVVSAVCPIKTLQGRTSTAVGDPHDIWSTRLRQLTMTEVMQLPETFGRDDIDWPDCPECLLVNTGCWVCRLDADWVPDICFRTETRIDEVNGECVARCFPEDWAMSVDLHHAGAKVLATRKVFLWHGQEYFHNGSAWGEWATDRTWEQHEAQRQLQAA